MNGIPHQRFIFILLVAFRWASLLPPLWLLFQNEDSIWSFGMSSGTTLLIAFTSTLIITIFHRALNGWLVRRPFLLAIDLLFVGALLTFSGGVRSPYYLTALSPLLTGAFFLQVRGGLFAALAFTPIYLFAVLFGNQITRLAIDLNALITQLVGFWLTPLLFGYMSAFLQQLRQARDALAVASKDLERQNKEISLAHHQLKIAYELTVLLQAAPDVASVQKRVLSAITGELGFPRAALGMVEPGAYMVSDWQVYPDDDGPPLPPVPITPEGGVIAQALQDHCEYAYTNGKPLSSVEAINAWVGRDYGLVIPLYLREHTVGVLLVVTQHEVQDPADERIKVLKLVAGQVAVALGTTMMCIDRARQLAIEQERNRIARDIHDSVSQSLFGIAFTLDASIKMLPGQASLVKKELSELRVLANKVREQVRHSIFDLWPSDLTLERFKADLQSYVNGCSIPDSYPVHFKVGEDFNGLSPSIRRNLYRVTQEALANAARHSRSEGAEVCLSVLDDQVHLKIRDQGQGFNPDLVLVRRHDRERFGLHGIQERIDELGGECEILSRPGQGTQILVSVPRNRKADLG